MKKFLILLTALVFAFPSVPCRAEEAVRVHTTILVASNNGNDFNLVNDAYRDQLIQLFSYTAYTQVDDINSDLANLQPKVLDLPDGYQLTLTLTKVEKGRVMVQAGIRKDNKEYLDTVVSILRPGVVFLGGPPAQGGALIIVLETGF